MRSLIKWLSTGMAKQRKARATLTSLSETNGKRKMSLSMCAWLQHLFDDTEDRSQFVGVACCARRFLANGWRDFSLIQVQYFP
jgi:hypothetical protein